MLLLDLAHQVVKDGEGARKFVEITVVGAASNGAAERIALSIANSPLVKTAIAGEDANWGRIVAAVGKAGEKAERDRLAIWFGDIRVASKGQRDPAYDEAAVSKLMKSRKSTSMSKSASDSANPPFGPATSPRNMSKSTAITARDALIVRLEREAFARHGLRADRRRRAGPNRAAARGENHCGFVGVSRRQGRRRRTPRGRVIRELREELSIEVNTPAWPP